MITKPLAKLFVAPTKDQIAAAEAANPNGVGVVETSAGTFIVKGAGRLFFCAFMDEATDESRRMTAVDKYVRHGIVYPDPSSASAALDARPGVVALLSQDMIVLDGGVAEREEKS